MSASVTDTPLSTAELAAQTAPRITTELPGPLARTVIERDQRVTSPSLTRVYPLVVARGGGAVLEDVDGNRFLDFNAGIAVNAAGHAHPAVTQAITAQAERCLHYCSSDFYHPVYAELCERLSKSAPMPDARTFLANSGTEAVEAALKLSRYHTRRPNVIAFYGGFHGRSLGSLSLTSSKAKYRSGFGIVTPGSYHAPFAFDGDVTGAEYIETVLFQHITEPDDVAAVFVEPIQGEGGYVVPPAGWLADLRALCDQHGILLVFDEVQCGVGRTGRMFACEHEGVEPDVLLTAKGLGSGMPIGAIISKESVTRWERGAHGSTFGGNPVCCAAALATLDLVEGGLAANAERMGTRLLAGLRALAERHPSIGDVRGVGLMIGIELVANRTTREPAPDLVHALQQRAFERGLLVLGAGKSTLRLAPPLVIDEYDVDTALGMIDECLGEIA
jgi:4-aminobutyrate aminotransferase